MRGRVRDNKRFEHDVRIAETRFDLLDGPAKADFRILETDVPNALRVDEDDARQLALDEPQDEIRMEVPHLEKARISLVEHLQVLDEAALDLVERHGRNFDQVPVEEEKRLVQVSPESGRPEAAKLSALERSCRDRHLELIQFFDDLGLRLLDEDPIVVFDAILAHESGGRGRRPRSRDTRGAEAPTGACGSRNNAQRIFAKA